MKIKDLLILLVVLLAAYGVLMAVVEFPPYGAAENPIHNEVTERYIDKALEETGTLNMVTSIVLDYRAYDTLFETIVLFTAALAVVITLKSWKREDGGQ